MRALVTGASGFVGQHLCAHLGACGDEVIATDRRAHDGDTAVDVADAVATAAAFADAAPEVVYHLAGWSDVGASWGAPLDAFRANAEGTLNVLEAARSAQVRRVLVVSSADVYGIVGDDELPITESHPLRPVSPYAASKAAADLLGLQAHLGHGQDVLRVRAFNHLGPGQSERFVASALASRIAANEAGGGDEVPVGNLAARRDFTDVRDVVRAYRLLMEHGEPGGVYNVCRGVAVAIQQLADRLIGLAERPMQLVLDPERYRPVDVPTVLGDAGRLRAATGWEPAIDLDTTLADLLAHWRVRHRPG
jgi:GDP-4-dehydro-6-deoxy-D-mannose reductase